MTDQPTTGPVSVDQVDIDAANRAWNIFSKSGLADAFARHRLQSQPRVDAPATASVREALEKIRDWCAPVLCANCATNRETAVAALAQPERQPAPELVERDGVREALAPFASVADEYDDSEDDSFEVWVDAGPQRLIKASFRLEHYRRARRVLAALSQPQSAAPEPVDWIVGDSSQNLWRIWENGSPGWTPDRDSATRYARREDAEAVHAEDEDAWSVVPFAQPITACERDLREAWCPTCGATTPEGQDCAACAKWWEDNPLPPCSCAEVAGEDPNCVSHGRTTIWAKENPDVCQLADELADLRAKVAAPDRGEVASAWRGGITNTIALIDTVRREHRIAPGNKAFAAFDAALNDAIEKWFNFSRGASPTDYQSAEAEWKRFVDVAALAENGE